MNLLSDIRLFRYGNYLKEHPAVLLSNGTALDVSGYTNDFDEYFFQEQGVIGLTNWLLTNLGNCSVVPPNQRIGSCIARPSKIIGIGLNNKAHALEANLSIPDKPVIFLKAPSALSGPFDPIPIPLNAKKLDWESELAVIIGKRANYITEDQVSDFITGYTIANDISERGYQLEGSGQWTKGKSFDGFLPLGPYFIPKEQVVNSNQLTLCLKVNEIIRQKGNTSDMIFNIEQIISNLSSWMTLLPGDVIITGTLPGVGLGHQPEIYLKEGDMIINEISDWGIQRNKVISYHEWQNINMV